MKKFKDKDVELIIDIIRRNMRIEFSGPTFAPKTVLDINGLNRVEMELKNGSRK